MDGMVSVRAENEVTHERNKNKHTSKWIEWGKIEKSKESTEKSKIL